MTPCPSRADGALRRRLLLATLGLLATPAVRAEDPFPQRPIRLLVPTLPGSGGDAVARALAERLRPELGQPVLVENKPGAETTLGAETAAQAVADGHTLLLAHMSTMVLNPLLYTRLRYDPQRDFLPISRVADTSAVLVVHPDVPARTLAEFVAHVKAHPNKVSWGSALSLIRLLGETLKAENGLQMERISYRGGAAVMQDAAGKTIEMAIADLSAALPLIQAGRLRPLATTGPQRSPLLPQVPTVREAGHPEIEMNGWWALYAPARTPPAVIDRVNAATRKVLTQPDTVQRMSSQLGVLAVASTPQEVSRLMQDDSRRWAPVVKRLNLVQATPD